jgi:ABC-type transport system involved in multi-copper enzyme maturation permease subunit
MTGRAAVAVAVMTFREAVRDRVLYLLLAFALVMIATSRLLALLTVGSESRIVADTGLAAIAFFGVLTGVFLGVSLIAKEIEQRTAYTILARPITRGVFVAGKYLGLLATVLVNATVMSAGFLLLLLWRGEPILNVLPALWLTGVELAVVTALALFFSSVSTSTILGILFTMGIYVAGHLVWSFPILAARLGEGWPARAVMALYYVIPNLDRFNVRSAAVHGDPVPWDFILGQSAYGLGWIILLILAASLAFSRRDLT